MNEINQQQTLEVLKEEELGEALEAVLFAAGYPLPYEKLAETFGKTENEMKIFVKEYAKAYNKCCRGILFLVMDDCCQLCSKEKYKDYVRSAMGIKSSGKLSASCLEALAVIAYCSWAVGTLVDKLLIEQKGRLDAPGKPILYGTTTEFLRVFGLASLEDLPKSSSPFALRPARDEQLNVEQSAKDPESEKGEA